jgi:hypothetical protein
MALSGSGLRVLRGSHAPRDFRTKCFLLAKTFGVESAIRRRIAFNSGANPESGARTRTHSEGLASTGQKGKSPDAPTPNPRLK